ncbi:MAG: protease modulator HflC [Candidatus Eisenbacteria sp.]|nr:protease modulator HflC [Candidatus Eisenbacteria bacterium]
MRRMLTVLSVLALVLILLLSCTFEVPETEYAVILSFGHPRRIILNAGLAWKLPQPFETVVRIDKRLRILDPPEIEYLTLDKKNVLVDAFAAWEIADPLKFLVTVVDRFTAEAQLEDIMRAEVGAALGSHELSVLLSTNEQDVQVDQIMDGITRQATAKALEGYGIRVRAIRLKRLNFPEENRQAVFRRMEAERERIARQYRSEGEEQAEKVRAQADLEQDQILARADREAKIIQGDADAEAARIYADAYEKDPEFYEFVKTLEAYERFIDEDATIVMPSDSRLLRLLKEPK